MHKLRSKTWIEEPSTRTRDRNSAASQELGFNLMATDDAIQLKLRLGIKENRDGLTFRCTRLKPGC